MTFHQLRVFLSVAEFKSFTQAGLRLRMSQPDVSLHVRNLESEIGLALFERVGKKIYLTQAGQVLQEKANLLFAQLADTEQALAEVKGLLRGSLVIGASTTVGLYLLGAPITEFKRRYQGINVQLKMANTGPIEQMVLGLEVDVGFTIGTPIAELKSEKFIQDEIVLVLPAEHPLSKKKTIRTKDLAQETFVIREPGSITRRALDELFAKLETRPPILMELDSIQSVKWAVAEGHGISLIPKHAATSTSPSLAVCVKDIKDFSFSCPVNVIWNRYRKLSPAAQAFLGLARDYRGSPNRPERELMAQSPAARVKPFA
jgi:DNA-binding transcriptional LysR family regulator